jgi:hypothetical protein
MWVTEGQGQMAIYVMDNNREVQTFVIEHASDEALIYGLQKNAML